MENVKYRHLKSSGSELSGILGVDVETLEGMLIAMAGRGWKDYFEVHYTFERIVVGEREVERKVDLVPDEGEDEVKLVIESEKLFYREDPEYLVRRSRTVHGQYRAVELTTNHPFRAFAVRSHESSDPLLSESK